MALTNRKTKLVRAHLARARKVHHDAQSYGGSTGGRKSLGGGAGIAALNRRTSAQAAEKEIFKDDLDTYGARKSFFEGRYGELGT